MFVRIKNVKRYYKDLITNSVLRSAWKKGTLQNSQIESSEEIKEICCELSSRLEYDIIDRRRRLSLRTSAILLNGTTRIYKEELDKLYADCVGLDRAMIYRRRSYHAENTNSLTEISDEENKNESFAESKSQISKSNTVNESKISSESDITDKSNSKNISPCRASRKEKQERGIQTTRSFLTRKRNRRREMSFDETLPMGVVMVYEGNSRIPSGVICSSLNPDVRKLYRDI